ncbi:hypothetical protein [Streptomyces erythrochromogenes]|uniref:hypothetical protein n=1 Tax=Streptomyces erythrochromogenes TaxID=285574 RepID=UPI003823CE0E
MQRPPLQLNRYKQERPLPPVASPGAAASTSAAPAVASAAAVPVGLSGLCGQPCAAELDGFPQHFSAEKCAAARGPARRA